jgi:DUF971 family protein
MLTPTGITLHAKSRMLEIEFDDGVRGELPYEFLRVYSPSAEVRGHGAGQEVLQLGKRDIDIVNAEPVGHYALKLTFSDGHNTGLFSWEYLHRMCREQAAMWQDYLDRLQAAGHAGDSGRDPQR